MTEKRIDLNLMTVFAAVMAEASVTRAAQRLSMSQPAVSNALRRLRHLFKDELFIKIPGGIRPTEKATAIWPDLQRALEQIRALALPPDFSPASTTAIFNIAITDTLIARAMPVLAARLMREAPQARLNFHPHSNPGSAAALEKGAIDCAVGMFPSIPAGLQVEGLTTDDYVCIFRRGHPILRKPLTLEQFIAAKHVLVKQATWQIGMVDAWLSLESEKRDIVMVVNSSADAIAVVRNSDLATAAPESFVRSLASHDDLDIAPLPFRHEKILYKMVWHERADRDAARIWLRTLVREAIIETCGEQRLKNPAPQPAIRARRHHARQ